MNFKTIPSFKNNSDFPWIVVASFALFSTKWAWRVSLALLTYFFLVNQGIGVVAALFFAVLVGWMIPAFVGIQGTNKVAMNFGAIVFVAYSFFNLLGQIELADVFAIGLAGMFFGILATCGLAFFANMSDGWVADSIEIGRGQETSNVIETGGQFSTYCDDQQFVMSWPLNFLGFISLSGLENDIGINDNTVTAQF